MGWQSVSKWLIIGLIIGLLVGFGGGYYYKNLNAEAPVATNTTTTTPTVTEPATGDISTVFAGGIISAAYGANRSLASLPSNYTGSSLASKLSSYLVPSALAQTTCSSGFKDLISGTIGQILTQYIVGQLKFDPRCAQLTWSGADSISYSIYLSGTTVYGSVTTNSDITLTFTWYDKNCQKQTKTEVIKKGTTVNVKIDKNGAHPVDSIPPGAILLCRGEITIPSSGSVGGFENCPCKGPATTALPPTTSSQ